MLEFDPVCALSSMLMTSLLFLYPSVTVSQISIDRPEVSNSPVHVLHEESNPCSNQ